MTILFILCVAISTLLTFAFALKDGYKKYSPEYMDVMLSSWLKIGLVLLPFIIYLFVAAYINGLEVLLNSNEIVLAATLISLQGLLELCGGIAIKHNRVMNSQRVMAVAVFVLIVYSISLSLMVIFYAIKVGGVGQLITQLVMLMVSIISYFVSGAVMTLIEKDISPKKASD